MYYMKHCLVFHVSIVTLDLIGSWLHGEFNFDTCVVLSCVFTLYWINFMNIQICTRQRERGRERERESEREEREGEERGEGEGEGERKYLLVCMCRLLLQIKYSMQNIKIVSSLNYLRLYYLNEKEQEGEGEGEGEGGGLVWKTRL